MQLTRAIEERCFSITCRRWNSRPYQNMVATLFHPSAAPPSRQGPYFVCACVCTFCFYVSLYVCTILAVASARTFTSSSHHLLIQHLAFCFLAFFSVFFWLCSAWLLASSTTAKHHIPTFILGGKIFFNKTNQSRKLYNELFVIYKWNKAVHLCSSIHSFCFFCAPLSLLSYEV